MIRMPDLRYFELHGKCAAGTLNPVERIELDALCAIKEAESPTQTPPSTRSAASVQQTAAKNHGD